MLCAVESVTCGVPGVFVSRHFQRRVQSPVTGANPSNPLDSQHKPETTSTLEIGLVHLYFRSYPGSQARSIGAVVVHAYSPSGICALVCRDTNRTNRLTAGMSSQMRALEIDEAGEVSKLKVNATRSIPRKVPAASGGGPMALVQVHSAALNPVDIENITTGMCVHPWPLIPGCDMAGSVIECEDKTWKAGDRVFAYTDMGQEWAGTLAEYCAVPVDTLGKIPDDMDFDAAATVGLCGLTAAHALGLWQPRHLGLPKSGGDGKPVLVYGASSSVGQFAVQLLKNSGFRVIGAIHK